MSKILIVDKSMDRKKRIAALKERGFLVFPALKLDEARSRCRPGAYDLIVVNAQDEAETAASFCEELSKRNPAQAVLMTVLTAQAILTATTRCRTIVRCWRNERQPYWASRPRHKKEAAKATKSVPQIE